MKSFDIKPLVEFAIMVIVISIVLGQYGKLREFIIEEFAKSLNTKSQLRIKSFEK